MEIFKPRVFVKTIFSIFLAIILTATNFTLPVIANISVSPYNANKSDSSETEWFILSSEAGEKISDSLSISNSGDEDREVLVLAKDFKDSPEGTFTIISDQEENQDVGNWIKLDINKLIIPASQNIELPFEVQIPNDAKDGEYAAGFGVTELTSKKDQTVQIAVRKGVRTYIAVGSDFNLGAKIENLNILDPKDSDYLSLKSSKQYFGKENTILGFDAQNTGNIFGVLSCKYALTYEDGEVFESIYNTELAPRVESKKQYIITNQAYKVGITKAVVDCTIKPQNITNESLKLENQKQAISDELNLSQIELDNFESSKSVAFSKENQNEITLKEPQEILTQAGVDNNIWLFTASLLILLSSLAVFLYFRFKNKKLPRV